jgi:hypothetical protein
MKVLTFVDRFTALHFTLTGTVLAVKIIQMLSMSYLLTDNIQNEVVTIHRSQVL